MARQLRRHVDSLRELDRSRRELVATVSHDLRTPLTSMRGYLETLQIADGCMPAARRKHFTEIALRHCDRLERLVDQLLTLARVDGPLVRLNLEPLSAAELVQDIVTKLQLRAESAAIRLAMEVDTSIPRIVADIGMIECVLENLADNALRHTPRGGSVVIRAYAEHDSAWIEVQDTGCGVPPSDLARLRRPLETGPGGHVGLGLSIVERVLRLHGSCLELSSKPGHGTLARFGLAVASARDFSTFADPSWAREDLVNS
jgi:signal transduction histidine kinase